MHLFGATSCPPHHDYSFIVGVKKGRRLSVYGLPKLKPTNYLIETKLEVEVSTLLEKKKKQRNGDLEGKDYTSYLGLLIGLPLFLSLELALSRGSSR